MQIINLPKRFLAAISRQISIILAIAAYENDRRSTGSSVGSWESLVNPFQIMLFFIGIGEIVDLLAQSIGHMRILVVFSLPL